jgi:hypothetical protein
VPSSRRLRFPAGFRVVYAISDHSCGAGPSACQTPPEDADLSAGYGCTVIPAPKHSRTTLRMDHALHRPIPASLPPFPSGWLVCGARFPAGRDALVIEDLDQTGKALEGRGRRPARTQLPWNHVWGRCGGDESPPPRQQDLRRLCALLNDYRNRFRACRSALRLVLVYRIGIPRLIARLNCAF